MLLRFSRQIVLHTFTQSHATVSSSSSRFLSLSASQINAMPARTHARQNGASATTPSVPVIEVQIPPPLKVAKVRTSGPRARGVKVKVESLENDTASSNGEKENDPPVESLNVVAAGARKTQKRGGKREIKAESNETAAASKGEDQKPTRKRRRAATKPSIIEEDGDDVDDSKSDGFVDAEAVKQEENEEDKFSEGEDLDSDGEPIRRGKNGRKIPKRKKKTKEPIVYVIPDVPSRDFTREGSPGKLEERRDGFKGRLGYACLNTIMRNQDPPVFCSRNVRIKTIEEKGLDYVKELAIQNVKDLVSSEERGTYPCSLG
jgi:hypothetical protein